MHPLETIVRLERIFRQTAYLAAGNTRQRSAYRALGQINLFETLSSYHPVLAGTVPLDIDTDSSDLDILCEVHDPDIFEKVLDQHYSHMTGYTLSRHGVNGVIRTVARWNFEGWEIEVFAQPRSVEQQNGFRHMVIEHRLLEMMGDQARQQIRMRKQQGMKTEPAFAHYLSLVGDPYETLLNMYTWDDQQLQQLVRQAGLL